MSLAASYSSDASAAVPLALPGFTAEFEMGSGGSQALWPPSLLSRAGQINAVSKMSVIFGRSAEQPSC